MDHSAPTFLELLYGVILTQTGLRLIRLTLEPVRHWKGCSTGFGSARHHLSRPTPPRFRDFHLMFPAVLCYITRITGGLQTRPYPTRWQFPT